MRKTLLPAVALLCGCASDTIVQGLPQSMRLTPPGAPRYIVADEFTYPTGPQSRENAARCVALTVSNRDVTLGDASGSFVGPATGRYYSIHKSQTAQGGAVTQYADDRGIVIANGRTQFTSGILNEVLDYRVEVDASADNQLRVTFTSLAVASRYTGSAPNTGFSQPGAWPGADPMGVHTALQGVADALASCMTR